MLSADPWLWTTQDLVGQLCDSAHLFNATGYPVPIAADLQLLKAQILNSQVTGAGFISNIDAIIVRNTRVDALTAIVQHLRSKSLLYQQQAATAGVQALDINGESRNKLPLGSTSTQWGSSDADGRKRRKISHIQTVPLPTTSIKQGHVTTTVDGETQDLGSGAGHWDHLLHWQQDEMNELDSEGDLGESDDEEDAVDIVEDEDPGSVDLPRPRTGKLNEDEIVGIINERIEFYTNDWRPGKGEDQIPDPQTLWEEAEATGSRLRLAEKCKTDIEHCKYRLDCIGNEIMRSSWNSVEGVRRICGTLETTVNNIELAEWLLSIYELSPENNGNYQGAGTNDQGSHLDAEQLCHHPTEIIDLGSGSDTSGSQNNDTDEMLLDNNSGLADGVYGNVEMATEGGIATPESMVESLAEERESILQQTPNAGAPTQGIVPHGDNPGSASINSVSRWNWDELIIKVDRKRIVMRVIYEMNSEDREMIRMRVNSVRKQNLLMEIPACIAMFIKKESKLPGVLPRDMPKITTFTKLFLSWWLADNYLKKEATERRLKELAQCLNEGCADPEIFYDWVKYIMANTFSEEALKTPHAPSQAEVIVISDDED